MKIISGVVSGISRLARLDIELSKEARHRLKWFDYYDSHGRNARLTCRHFDVSPQTFYRWKKRYNPHNLKSLESHSCRPGRVRQPAYSPEFILAVQQLREEYSRWGKDKLVVLLHREGFSCSTSTVGRIITRLKVRGVLKEPLRNHVSAHSKGILRPYGTRKPKGYRINEPGDLVQLDTLDLRPLPGVVLKHFTARDMVSRWDVMNVYHRATAVTSCHFLDELKMRMPFPVRAVQVDGGAEFEAEFEQECQRRNIKLFILPPRSPELNGCVERAHRTHTEEFYEVTGSSFELAELRIELMHWEQIYNTIRPHQALGYLTPFEFIKQRQQKSGREVMCH
jgi:transposase InsO family protein